MKEKNQKEIGQDNASLIKQTQADPQLLSSEYLNDMVVRAAVFKQMDEQRKRNDCNPVIEVP
ncbi:MAG TPA: hypothetical protein O0X27_07090 [Methanocorpusculum sp.]|nr:hypothetical protein [Methanocorpusculum sp.]